MGKSQAERQIWREDILSSHTTKTVRVDYFALLKEQRGLSSEQFETKSTTVKELYDELKAMHNFSLPHSSIGVALNDEFTNWDKTLSEKDKVVFIPPVAGG